jgi:hypothetical protein
MSETKWTPGPWRTEGNDIGGWQIWHDNSRHEQSLCICQRSDWPHYAERSAANARLIAAARKRSAASAWRKWDSRVVPRRHIAF